MAYGRTLRTECPKCRSVVELNWRRSMRKPKTIEVWVRPDTGKPSSVCFRCSGCRYVVTLGVQN